MLPLGHGAFAYLTYVALAAGSGRRLPLRWELVPLAVGSQLPDLIDKPLAFYHLLDSGRSLGHSVFTGTAVLLAAAWLVRVGAARTPDGSWQRRLSAVAPLALTVGYATHLAGDAVGSLGNTGLAGLQFLVWPFIGGVRGPGDDIAPWIRLLRAYREPATHPQLELIAAAAAVFFVLNARERLR